MQGRSQDFSKGGVGHTGSNNIVMAFSPRNIVGCLLKKRLTKGGHGHPRTPLATPLRWTAFLMYRGIIAYRFLNLFLVCLRTGEISLGYGEVTEECMKRHFPKKAHLGR